MNAFDLSFYSHGRRYVFKGFDSKGSGPPALPRIHNPNLVEFCQKCMYPNILLCETDT